MLRLALGHVGDTGRARSCPEPLGPCSARDLIHATHAEVLAMLDEK